MASLVGQETPITLVGTILGSRIGVGLLIITLAISPHGRMGDGREAMETHGIIISAGMEIVIV